MYNVALMQTNQALIMISSGWKKQMIEYSG